MLDSPSPEAMVELFAVIADEVGEALDQLHDWGHSGFRDDQYRHDVVADELIVPRLLAAGMAVFTEESGRSGEGQDITVIVDPIDGSTNASLGLPWYATSLCAVDQRGPLASLVRNLATGETYSAIRAQGAVVARRSRSDEVLRQPLERRGAAALKDAVIGLSGLPPSHGGWAQFRAYGACALDLCAVAEGRLDGYLDVDDAHGSWDYLGAALVVSEAGGFVSDAFDRSLVSFDRSVRRNPVAASSEELLGALKQVRRQWMDADES